MNVAGTGITTFQARLKQAFKVETTYGLRYFQTSGGAWRFIDRGATYDHYETEITLQGIRGRVEQFITEIAANRTAGSNVLTLSAFASNEHIFGADVNHSGSISATLLDAPRIIQNGLKSYECSATLRAISPTFLGSATLPDFKYLDIGFDANVSRYTINKIDSYSGSYTYLDMQADVGTFKGRFQFTDTEMKNLRTWYRVNRGTTASVTVINGVNAMWGPLRGGYTATAKLLSITQEEMRDLSNWYCTLTFGEVI